MSAASNEAGNPSFADIQDTRKYGVLLLLRIPSLLLASDVRGILPSN